MSKPKTIKSRVRRLAKLRASRQRLSRLIHFTLPHLIFTYPVGEVLEVSESADMVLEEQRLLHEDLERLEQAIADRVLDDPKHVSNPTFVQAHLMFCQIRDRLNRDHQIATFLSRIQSQSKRLLAIYKDEDGAKDAEIQSISTGDPFEEFYKQYSEIRDFHKRYPNEPVENLERAYKRRADGEPVPMEVDTMFTGEEGYGRFFDLTILHEQYLNLPGVKGARRITYLQYLDAFDIFTPPQCPIKKPDKMTDAYFQYLGALVSYLEEFLNKIRPLEDLEKIYASFDEEFEKAWESSQVPGWDQASSSNGTKAEVSGDGTYCDACQKEFKNENVYQHHLTQKKHLRAVEAKKNASSQNGSSGVSNSLQRLKEKAIAEREFRIRKLASAMQTERSDTHVNVERKQGMTERERQQELEAFMAEQDFNGAANGNEESDSEGEEKMYNPLKLPLGWDGKPIPFWLYKLHGLGVEYSCEICGNFVYMGRRAFEKHFSEQRHVHGLKCLGVTNTTLFREITGIEDALKLWDKIQREKKKEKSSTDNVVQMEDAEGNVMPEKVYNDLRKQGLL
jgi:splicing factor 3A subunit 3